MIEELATAPTTLKYGLDSPSSIRSKCLWHLRDETAIDSNAKKQPFPWNRLDYSDTKYFGLNFPLPPNRVKMDASPLRHIGRSSAMRYQFPSIVLSESKNEDDPYIRYLGNGW